jgi:cystathionine beta-lyase/cystathionine gamma-synthase
MPRPQSDDICPRMDSLPAQTTQPAANPIYPASVYVCEGTDQAQSLLEGGTAGYVYQRHGHPNADVLAEKCRELHGAERAAIASSGMAALAAILLSQLKQGEHIVASNQLYGASSLLLTQESNRLGINCNEVDTCDLDATKKAIRPETRMIVVETIANPRLRVADIAALANLAHQHEAKLLADNTFATPMVCRPLEHGADFVLESISKMMNGHSDVMLGLICGNEADWERMPLVLSAWGLASSPWDCWLAARGLATMHLRMERAMRNAQLAAEYLSKQQAVEQVDYPGLPEHPDHEIAKRQLSGGFGNVVTFRLVGGRPAADRFISAAKQIPFCPSLGEVSTTLSHPQSTSHRGLSEKQRDELGITGGTIRLSVGTESSEFVLDALREGLG